MRSPRSKAPLYVLLVIVVTVAFFSVWFVGTAWHIAGIFTLLVPVAGIVWLHDVFRDVCGSFRIKE
ncbi:Uncharacterised protein [Chlamydia trachomatis]|nr:Uncharacterised protein [Chlamydia trachomatis]